MSRTIDSASLQVQLEPGSETWMTVTLLTEVEWTGFAPAGCGVDQGRIIARPEDPGSDMLDPDAPDHTWRLLDGSGQPLFEFLGYVDDRRPRATGKLALGISTTPELLGTWRELQPAAAH